MSYQIRPLSVENLEGYLSFFNNMPFPHHPHWDCCYCYSFHFTGKSGEWNKENNLKAVRAMVPRGDMKGYLAYQGEEIVGWCNANRRSKYARLPMEYTLPDPEMEGICALVCFLVHPGHRRKGLSRALLDRVEKDYKADGFNAIEAYPRKNPADEEGLYPGAIEMYLSSGFRIIAEEKEHVVVRKDLHKK